MIVPGRGARVALALAAAAVCAAAASSTAAAETFDGSCAMPGYLTFSSAVALAPGDDPFTFDSASTATCTGTLDGAAFDGPVALHLAGSATVSCAAVVAQGLAGTVDFDPRLPPPDDPNDPNDPNHHRTLDVAADLAGPGPQTGPALTWAAHVQGAAGGDAWGRVAGEHVPPLCAIGGLRTMGVRLELDALSPLTDET